MWVDGDGGVEIVESLGELDGFLVFDGVGADGKPAGDGGGSAASDDGIDIVGQFTESQMTVGVNQFHKI